MNPTAVINKVNQVLTRFTPIDRTAYLRTITRTGDTLIGRTTAVSYVDTVFSPQPFFLQLGRERLSGGRDQFQLIKTASNKIITADDWQFMFSTDALSLDEIQNPNVSIVLKNTAGVTEVFDIIDYDTVGFSAVDILINVYARSVGRG